MSFTDDQVEALKAKLDGSHVKSRKQGNAQVQYVEGWHAIAEANRIFGYDAWDRSTVDLHCVSERERLIGQQQKPGWGVTYNAKVRITVRAGGVEITREGVGSGHGIDLDLGQAHESAIKEAETDAMKRALMTFGNPFGLALYDKDRTNVGVAPVKVDPITPPAAFWSRPDYTFQPAKSAAEYAAKLIGAAQSAPNMDCLNKLEEDQRADIDRLRTDSTELHGRVYEQGFNRRKSEFMANGEFEQRKAS